jgi:hypothetical protein
METYQQQIGAEFDANIEDVDSQSQKTDTMLEIN